MPENLAIKGKILSVRERCCKSILRSNCEFLYNKRDSSLVIFRHRRFDNRANSDIVSGGFVNRHGALGVDGRFGVFPSAGQGRAALDALLRSRPIAVLALMPQSQNMLLPSRTTLRGMHSSCRTWLV